MFGVYLSKNTIRSSAHNFLILIHVSMLWLFFGSLSFRLAFVLEIAHVVRGSFVSACWSHSKGLLIGSRQGMGTASTILATSKCNQRTVSDSSFLSSRAAVLIKCETGRLSFMYIPLCARTSLGIHSVALFRLRRRRFLRKYSVVTTHYREKAN